MATTTSPTPTDMTGQVLTEAARRMLPVLAGKLMTALADQAVARVEEVADRLDASREGLGADRGSAGDDTDPGETGSSRGSGGGGVGAFLLTQARALLDLVVRLVARAAEMLRRATERLRARRAPEGIEAEGPEELESAEDVADLEDAELDEAELEDAELEDEHAMA